jgi:hypothetical protein
MDTVYRRCAAVDVHLKSNEVCVRLAEEGETRSEVPPSARRRGPEQNDE